MRSWFFDKKRVSVPLAPYMVVFAHLLKRQKGLYVLTRERKVNLYSWPLKTSMILLLSFVVRSKNDAAIRLTHERWAHISASHTDMKNNKDLVLKTVKEPAMILKGVSDELRAVRFFTKTHLGPKYVMVAYKELNDGEGFIITAYKTSKIDKIVKRGVIWKK
jgi:hypothetical protein